MLGQQRGHGVDIGEFRDVGQHDRSSVSMPAAISGRAAFLAPPIWISPARGRPPRIRIRSILILTSRHSAASGAALTHIFTGLAGIADLARLVALQEQKLADALMRVDARRQRRGVADFDRHLAFPLGLQRGDVHDDATAGVSGLAQTDDQTSRGMRKYSIVWPRAKLFGGMMQVSVLRSTKLVGAKFFGSITAESMLVKILNSSAIRAS